MSVLGNFICIIFLLWGRSRWTKDAVVVAMQLTSEWLVVESALVWDREAVIQTKIIIHFLGDMQQITFWRSIIQGEYAIEFITINCSDDIVFHIKIRLAEFLYDFWKLNVQPLILFPNLFNACFVGNIQDNYIGCYYNNVSDLTGLQKINIQNNTTLSVELCIGQCKPLRTTYAALEVIMLRYF